MTPPSGQTPHQDSRRFGPGIVFALAAAIALGFALFTDQRWEDYYITFRVSQNLAHGLGLVFQPGERVHAFTSPLGVLLPAFLSWLTGGQADELTLWLFRVVTIAAFAGAATTVWCVGRRLGWTQFSRALGAGLVMTDAKSVAFSTNGMETGLMLLFVALTVHAFTLESGPNPLRLGLLWGALLWTRPDSFVFFGGLALGWFLFGPVGQGAGARGALARQYGKAALIAAGLYLPWFAWAWWYFGSPIPHTVVAKAFDHHLPSWTALLLELVIMPLRAWGPGGWDAFLTPVYFVQFGGWPYFIVYGGRLMIGIALLAFVFPGMSPLIRSVSVALAIATFYLINVDLFPWYLPPAALLVFIAWSGVLDACLKAAWVPGLPQVLGIAALLFTTTLLLGSAWELRQQQRIIEGQRRAIGEWLAAHRASPHDTVFLEPLGYIGYYSQLKMFDYPGLSSPEVVDARRRLGENRLDLVAALTPTWVVQRPGELHSSNPQLSDWFLSHYLPVKIFNASDQVAAVSFLPGRPYLQFDQGFLVWHWKG